MKAQARKILALIMAMVMCLSLAAPAFAAEEAVEDTSAETSTVETVETETETEEVEEKKAEKLEKQDLPSTVEDATSTDNKTIVVTGKVGNNSGVTIDTIEVKDIGDKLVRDYVTVEKASVVNGLVGETTTITRYIVTANKGFGTFTKNVDIESDTKVSLKDITSWTELVKTTGDWYEDSSKVKHQVSGSYYAEKQQSTGKYKIYFKLAKVEGDAFKTIDVAKNGVVWAVANSDTATPTMKTALKDAVTCSEFGKTDGEYNKKLHKGGAAKKLDTSGSEAASKRYNDYAVSDANGATVTGGDSLRVDEITSTDGKASFKVRATYVTKVNNVDTTVAETDADELKAILNKNANGAWEVTSVSAADANGYFTVSVATKNNATAGATGYTGNTGTNTVKFGEYVVLDNVQENGKYTEDSTEKTIEKGYKLAGPVAVAKEVFDKDEDLTITTDTNVTLKDKYYYAKNMETLLKKVENANCGASKTVPYVQLNVYAKKDATTAAPGLTLNGTTLTAADNWAEVTGADITTGLTATVPAKAEHSYATVTDLKAATCKTAGSVTTKQVCIVCGKVKSGSEKTETLPVNQANLFQKDNKPVVVYTDGKKVAAGTYTAPTNVDPKWTKVTTATDISSLVNNANAHYINKVTTTVTATTSKTGAGTSVTTFTCNLGEVHDELTVTEEIAKTKLQNRGSWDYIDWGTQNAANVRDYTKLYGWTPVVQDTDIDYTSTPVEAYKLAWAGVTPANKEFALATDTNLTVPVYSKDANGNLRSSTQYFNAVLAVKDIKNGVKDCQDGSATIEIKVYKLAASNTNVQTAENLETALKNKTAELVNTYTKAVVIPAEKTHVDANSDGKCDNCGTDIEQGATQPTGKIDMSTATVKFTALKWTGKEAQPKVAVTLDGVELAKGIDYEVEDFQETNAGTYDLIVAGKGLFTGRVVGKVTINKVAGKIKASGKAIQAKKKKAVKGKMTIKVTGGEVKSVKASGVKGVKVTKTGVITVPKKCKGGTLKVKITMTADDNHTAAKTKTVKVKIKKAK